MNSFSQRLGATAAATLFATVAFSAAASAGCGSCWRGFGGYAPVVPYVEPVDMTPRYMVNQGPVYDGPAIQVPVLTYSESLSAYGHPYVRGVRGYHVRGYSDAYVGAYTGGPYAHPTSHETYRYGHRYYGYGHRYYHRNHYRPRVYGVNGRALDVPMAPGVSVVRARADARYVSPHRAEPTYQYNQKPRKQRRYQEY